MNCPDENTQALGEVEPATLVVPLGQAMQMLDGGTT